MPEDSAPHSHGRLLAWARLVRLPNLFTVLADVGAAFALILGMSAAGRVETVVAGADAGSASGMAWPAGLAIALTAAVCLYWAGLVLNDVFDVRADRRGRSTRPLPQRDIRLTTARRVGWGLLAAGVLACTLFPLVSLAGSAQGVAPRTALPVGVAVLLAVCIVAYDGPFKRTMVAPLWMGACRVLSFLLGASAALATLPETHALSAALGTPLFSGLPVVVVALAVGMGTYITGITTFARRESIGDASIHLPLGWAAMLAGGLLIALSPRLGTIQDAAWKIDAGLVYPIAIALMLFPTLNRGRAAIAAPSPARIQTTIRSGILAIIPLAAAIAMLGAGAAASLAVFALLIPSRWLARRLPVT